MNKLIAPLAFAASLLLIGCQSASEHAAQVHQAQEAGDRMTVGQVQREISYWHDQCRRGGRARLAEHGHD